MEHLLSLVIFSPLIGIAIIALVPRIFEEGARAVAFFTSLFTFGLVCFLWSSFNPALGFSFRELVSWVPSLNINYSVGIDGVSLLMIALTSLLTPLCVAASWEEIATRRKEFYSLLLVCEIGLIGAFAATDLFLFYMFWEVMLIPMYFLIGIWGSGNRIHVALKFLLYTMVGSVMMLVGIIYLYFVSGNTFDMASLGRAALSSNVQVWLFLAFAIAFAIKVPIFPFHTWLPDAHTESPTAGSVLLAGAFLKAGTYGFYRIAMPYFPDAVALLRPYILTLAVVSIIYGALVSMVQKDLKRLIAYSSVSHMGFVILGLIALNPEGVRGAVLQMANHGISTGALFLLFGMIYARTHTRQISEFGGVARVMPLYAGLFVFAGLSSLGLPGLNNFVGEILVLFGAFKFSPPAAIVSASCVIFAAIYILWAIERVFFGTTPSFNSSPLEGEDKRWGGNCKDISLREFALLIPLLIGIVWFGVYPKFLLAPIENSTTAFLNMARRSIVTLPSEGSLVIVPEIYERTPKLIIPDTIKMPEKMEITEMPEKTEIAEPPAETGEQQEFPGGTQAEGEE